MSRILDKSFRYTPAAKQTTAHMKALFAKERERLEAAKAEQSGKVRTMPQRKGVKA